MIIIGSRAFSYIYKDFTRITGFTDYDVIMSMENFKKWFKKHKNYIVSCVPSSENKYKVFVEKGNKKIMYEIEVSNNEGNSEDFLLKNIDKVTLESDIYKDFLGDEYRVLNGRFLGLTKKSHIYYPIHFEKNIKDYIMICKNEETLFNEESLSEIEKKYLSLRTKEVQERTKQKTPKLNVTTDDFFSSKLPVDAYFVHDDLHELMAHRHAPIFTMMQKDNSKAWCEKDMFFKLPLDYRLEAVVEEAYVIALERYIIPQFNKNLCENHHEAWKAAVKRICTTLTSGWFREFAVNHYEDVLDKYDDGYVQKFINAYKNGEIQPKDEFNDSKIPLIEVLKEINAF